jgi:hypothetical protein
MADVERPLREGESATLPGSYQPAVRFDASIIDPGEELRGEMFICGYGHIGQMKLGFYPSQGFIEETDSRVSYGLTREQGKLVFGGEHSIVGPAGVTLSLPKTLVFDVGGGPLPMVSTEALVGQAPVAFRLKTPHGVRPGTHTLFFVLTYFNGERWATATQSVSFTVRNVLQRHEVAVTALGVLATAATVVGALVEVVHFFTPKIP